MKFIKNNKKIIAAFAAGGIIFSGITGFAVNTYLASNIQYTKSGASNSITVSQALNELYAMKENKYTTEEYQNYGTLKYNEGLTAAKGLQYNYGSGKVTSTGDLTFDTKISEPSKFWLFLEDGTDKVYNYYEKQSNTYTRYMVGTRHGNNLTSNEAPSLSETIYSFGRLRTEFANWNYYWVAIK